MLNILKSNNCVVRQEHGTDIDAACGQLRSNTMKRDREKALVENVQPQSCIQQH